MHPCFYTQYEVLCTCSDVPRVVPLAVTWRGPRRRWSRARRWSTAWGAAARAAAAAAPAPSSCARCRAAPCRSPRRSSPRCTAPSRARCARSTPTSPTTRVSLHYRATAATRLRASCELYTYTLTLCVNNVMRMIAIAICAHRDYSDDAALINIV